MKKTLLLLLLTVSSFAQTGILTPVDRLRIKTPQELNTNAQVLTRSTTTGETGFVAKTDLQDVFKFTTASALPTNGVVGKFYYTIDSNKYYAFDGTIYKEVGASAITGLTANKLTKWNGTQLVDSVVTEVGGEIQVNGNVKTNSVLKVSGSGGVNSLTGAILLNNGVGKTLSLTSGVPYAFQEGLSIRNETDNTTLFYITDNGNAGIGTIVPSEKLSVNGNITALPGTLDTHVVTRGQLNTKQNTITGLTANRLTKSNGTDIVNSGITETASGRTLFNTTVDDGVNIIQANGTITASQGTLANQLVTKAQLDTKLTIPVSGVANRLTKFLTPTTLGNTVVQESATGKIGINTVGVPDKDLTLGNQENRQIAIEQSVNTVKGRDLAVKAGRTIDFAENQNFNKVNEAPTAGNFTGVATSPTGDVYLGVFVNSLLKQTGGTGAFVPESLGGMNGGVTVAIDNSVYAVATNVFKKTAGVGSYVSMNNSSLGIANLAASKVNLDVYAIGSTGGVGFIYKQTGGTGSFVDMNQVNRDWKYLATDYNGDVYAGTSNGIYRLASGGTTFELVANTIGGHWWAIACAPNGDLYANLANIGIYVRRSGSTTFTNLNQGSAKAGRMLAVSPTTGNAYSAVPFDNLYMQLNDLVGSPDLDGGTLKLASGTAKGVGMSRIEFLTGQKTASGTLMQLETLREYIDENGYHVYLSIPVYANDAAADADTNLPSRAEYQLTGNRTKFIKP